MGVPFIPELRQPLAEEILERDHFRQRGATFRRCFDQQLQAFAEQRGVLDMDGGIEVLRLLTRRVQAHPIHPLARDAGSPGATR